MQEAISIFFNIWTSTISWVFNSATISGNNVTLGWVIVAIWLFGAIIFNILNIPKGAARVNIGKKE